MGLALLSSDLKNYKKLSFFEFFLILYFIKRGSIISPTVHEMNVKAIIAIIIF